MRCRLQGKAAFAVAADARALLRSQGGPYYPKKGPNAPQTPYALGSGAGPCPSLVDYLVEWSRSYRTKYFPLLVESSMYSEDVTQLLCYLTWCQSNESRLVIDSLLEEFHQVRPDDHGTLGGLLRVAETLLGIADGNLQNQRKALFLHGETVQQRVGGIVQNEPPLPGFLDMITASTTPLVKRFCLLRWVAHLHDSERPNFWNPVPDACVPVLLVRFPCLRCLCCLRAALTFRSRSQRAADLVSEDFERNRQAQPGTYATDSLNPVIVRIREICESVYA